MSIINLDKKENRILREILKAQATSNTNETFLIFDSKHISFGETYQYVKRYANGLINLGIKSSERVCLYMDSCPEFIYLSLATNMISAHWIPISTDYKGRWLNDLLISSDPEIIITDESHYMEIINLADLKKKKKFLVAEKNWFEETLSCKKNISNLDELLGIDDEICGISQNYGDTTSILWTSGTTGTPKGVMQSNNTWIRSALSSVEIGEIEKGDVAFNCLPLYNSASWVTGIYPALLTGTTCAIDKTFSVNQFWNRTRHYGASHVFTLGAMHMFLWNAPPKINDQDNPVRSAQMVPMPDKIIPKFKKRFGIEAIHQGYGQSEVMYLMRRRDKGIRKFPENALGDVAEDLEVALFSRDGNSSKIGDPGELCVRAKEKNILFNGYFRNEKMTAKAFTNGWYHTGDLLKQDNSGNYFFIDRKVDLIRHKGRSVSSVAIESIVNKHPVVKACAAYGIESKELNSEHEIMLSIVLKEDKSLAESELVSFISENAPRFFIPRYIDFVDELPMTPTNKIKKDMLRRKGITQNTWDRNSNV